MYVIKTIIKLENVNVVFDIELSSTFNSNYVFKVSTITSLQEKQHNTQAKNNYFYYVKISFFFLNQFY